MSITSPFTTGTAVTKTQLDVLVAAINAVPLNSRSGKRSSSITLSTGDNPVGGYPDAGIFNVGSIAYGGGIFTVPSAGVYAWGATVGVAAGGTAGARAAVQALVNGTAIFDGRQDAFVGLTFEQEVTAGAPVPFNSGDTVQLDINATGGAAGVAVFPRLFWLTQIA